jgi:hypothetical protein
MRDTTSGAFPEAPIKCSTNILRRTTHSAPTSPTLKAAFLHTSSCYPRARVNTIVLELSHHGTPPEVTSTPNNLIGHIGSGATHGTGNIQQTYPNPPECINPKSKKKDAAAQTTKNDHFTTTPPSSRTPRPVRRRPRRRVPKLLHLQLRGPSHQNGFTSLPQCVPILPRSRSYLPVSAGAFNRQRRQGDV